MKPIEMQILRNIRTGHNPDETFGALKGLAENEPFGAISPEFINNPDLIAYMSKAFEARRESDNYTWLWLRIESYLSNKNNEVLAKEKLSQVEESLKTCLEKITPEEKARGTAMLPTELVNQKLMRELYSIEDENLSKLFLANLPAPRANVFKGQAVPAIVAKREQESTKATVDFLKRQHKDLASVEHQITKIQRAIRGRSRRHENLQRLSHMREGGRKDAERLLENANKVYNPRCDPTVAERIKKAAKKIELFSSVRHLTATTALESIFNDGLRGRRNLLQNYIPFCPAALAKCDIDNGDGNVVCLGANAIDPQAAHGIELQFDAKKIAENNPCVFFKQRDLGFHPEIDRNVKIGDVDVRFSHTMRGKSNDWVVSSRFDVRNQNQYAEERNYVDLDGAILIADNIQDMHQILTLNFFRFIDGLRASAKEKIYTELSKLTDDELEEKLLEIGKNVTDTMEFNFYGVYKIDFSALLTIKNNAPPYTLDLRSFIDTLNAGNLDALSEAMTNLPEIFNSYRFIDYLLSNTNNRDVINSLQIQRKKCTLPVWMEEIEKSEENQWIMLTEDNRQFLLSASFPGDEQNSKIILEKLPKNKVLEVLKQRDNSGQRLLSRVTAPDFLLTILNMIPENERSLALAEIFWQTPALSRLSNHPGFVLDILGMLPKNERLAVVKKRYWSINSNNSLMWSLAFLKLFPENERLAALKESDRSDYTLLSQVAHSEWLAFLKLFPENERLAALKVKRWFYLASLSQVAHSEWLPILEMLPENELLAALQEIDLSGHTLLSKASHSELLIFLKMLPENERLAALKEKDLSGHTLLSKASHSELLIFLKMLPENELLAALQEKDRSGQTLLSKASHSELLIFLKMLPENERLAALKEKDLSGHTLLSKVTHSELLIFLKMLPENELLAALQEKDRSGQTLLSKASHSELLIFLKMLPENERLAALKEKDLSGHTLLSKVTHSALLPILEMLPEIELLAALKEKDSNGRTILANAVKSDNTKLSQAILKMYPLDKRLSALTEEGGYDLLTPLKRANLELLVTFLKMLPPDDQLVVL